MQNLTTGVGDLQRVLTNVKVRGTWAEVQLGNLLDQILAPGQYERNVRVKADSSEVVEYAVRLPGTGGDPSTCLWLPIDSKFPQEDYRRVQDAADRADPEETKKAVEDLVRTIRAEAQKICERYINPPTTTDFAIMFLATEGLYGEVLRQASLVEELQRRFRVVIAGPTTLIAILNSLRMGFQTLAIEQRASEVAKVLGAVKTEFGKFNLLLDKVKRQLNTATRTIEESGFRRTRAIERALRSVEQLPEMDSAAVLQISDNDVTVELDELEEREVSISP
jgi:DNA recombination protein RmuC